MCFLGLPVGAEEGPSGAQLQELPEANQSEKKDEDLTEDMDEDTDTDEAETAADEDDDDDGGWFYRYLG